MHVSIVITCKGYRRHLEQSVPAWLRQQAPDGVTFDLIVVDYGCPDGTFDWLKTLTVGDGLEKRLRGMFVPDVGDTFNLNIARNVGARATSAEWILFSDADDVPPESALRDALAAATVEIELVNWTRDFGERRPSCFGSCLVRRDVWGVVRGYDETLGERYGYDDSDFYRRVRNDHDYAELPFDGWRIVNRVHGEATRFYETADMEAMKAENRRRIWHRGGVVNPNGFGVAPVRLWSPLPEFDGWMSWAELAWLEDRASKIPPGGTWVEVGVYLGRSFNRVGRSLPHGATLIGIDLFNSMTDKAKPPVYVWERLGAAVDDLQRARPDLRIVLGMPGAVVIPDSSVDGLFIDGDHSSEGVQGDLDRYVRAVKPCGVIGGHDYARDHYPDLCDVVDASFPDRRIHHTIWEARKPS